MSGLDTDIFAANMLFFLFCLFFFCWQPIGNNHRTAGVTVSRWRVPAAGGAGVTFSGKYAPGAVLDVSDGFPVKNALSKGERHTH